jgi:uncharacterized protein (TIGR02001 family)
MKKLLSAAAAVGALLATAGTAHAEAAFSGNVAIATDYVFRGLSQTDGPAVSGGFDYTNDKFYAGTWASNINFANNMELDVYGGFKPTLGPVSADFGVVGYLYPGVDTNPNADYFEVYGKGSIAPTETSTIGAAAYYSPDFTGESGDAWYGEINGSIAPSKEISFSAAAGYQWVDGDKTVFDFDTKTAAVDKSYWSWNAGGTYTISGFGLDLRYYGSEIGDDDPGFGSIAGDRFVFAVKRAL